MVVTTLGPVEKSPILHREREQVRGYLPFNPPLHPRCRAQMGTGGSKGSKDGHGRGKMSGVADFWSPTVCFLSQPRDVLPFFHDTEQPLASKHKNTAKVQSKVRALSPAACGARRAARVNPRVHDERAAGRAPLRSRSGRRSR